ncbi:MAG: dienelactone hydrolase [Candidatus Acidiferrum sp.]|jgi:alpha-beta hydrolase superfamily lysophospholipase
MRTPALAASVAIVAFLGGTASPRSSRAQSPAADTVFSVPPVDAPELAPRGPYGVGVRTLSLLDPKQVDILRFDKITGKAPLYDRPLTVEVWYPALLPKGPEERVVYEMPMPRSGATPRAVPVRGKALRDAAPLPGTLCPLVVVSHGYPGSRFFLSYLTENLASKGYVVAAIDHTDSIIGEEKDFSSTLLNRASDQLFTIAALENLAEGPDHFLHGLLDPARVAIVGYSMGGYGALASAGAGYGKSSLAQQLVPGGYLGAWTAGSPDYPPHLRKELQAVVAIAPWGNQPPYNMWDAAGLTGIHIPLLMIDGDQDDVSDFTNGVAPAFAKAVNSERCMLVYENARHNVGGNPPPPEAQASFTTEEYFDEPVWRKERITAINQHFITAFLDLYLKGDESKRPYLHVAPEKSNDGLWPLKRGESVAGQFSDGDKYWKGFERRWAVGLEMHCSAPGAASQR